MKLLGSTKNKIIKAENGKNVSCLKNTEVVLIDCNVINEIQEYFIDLFLSNCLTNY